MVCTVIWATWKLGHLEQKVLGYNQYEVIYPRTWIAALAPELGTPHTGVQWSPVPLQITMALGRETSCVRSFLLLW